ncbi:MAG: DUF1538 domain-containing protein, partial [Clostridia bacterium]|nr:DUF1538 domain-containing protein [Clostridia bacterium]
GVAVTVAEPDLLVWAETVPHISNLALLIRVGVGVGFFLALSMLRIIVGIRLRWLLMILYGLVFLLAIFADGDFLGVAFDSGGVTTGPMTVPFILALGVGVSNIRSDRKAESDSFGLVALCSVGPILAVMILGFFFPSGDASVSINSASFENTAAIGKSYLVALPHYLKEMAVALAPIVVIFLIFQFAAIKMTFRNFMKVFVGILYTLAGLTLFLTGVNVGFGSLGAILGQFMVASSTLRYLLIPLGAMMGWFIITAEPAVYVLEKQIEEVSAGAIPGKAIKLSLSIAIALAMALAMLRVLTGISLMWFLVPGYVIALTLSFFVPDIYTAIAFDSGGVASGPMTATFMLQFVIGASTALGGDILRDAFGVVALVAMMPLISIQVVGALYKKKKDEDEVPALPWADDEIVELWEEEAA